MSVFLFLKKVDEQKAKVMCIHNFPDMLTEKEKQNGVLVDSYPEPVEQNGKAALPYWNYVTQEVFFEYVDITKTDGNEQETSAVQTENIEQLQEDNSMIAETLALALEEIEQLKAEINTLKGE